MTCSFQARSGREFAPEWCREPGSGLFVRRSVLDAPLPGFPIARQDATPIDASRLRASGLCRWPKMRLTSLLVSIAFVAGLSWYAYSHYQLYRKFEVLKAELNVMKYDVSYDAVGVGFHYREIASHPIAGLYGQLKECEYHQGLEGLVSAMNYRVPTYSPFDSDGAKLAANRSILKGLIAPIAKDRRLYIKRGADGQWQGVGHWVQEKWYDYSVVQGAIVMTIRGQ